MIVLIVALGLFIGSFLNVCIARIPQGGSVVFPPSSCPRCGRRLAARELVPVLSFLWQRGKCRGCGQGISARYPLVELVTSFVFTLLYLRFPWPQWAFAMFFFAVLIVVFFIDLDCRIIPNRLVLLLLGVTVAALLFLGEPSWKSALAGGFLGGGLFLMLSLVSRGGMGGGDIKLISVLGLWFGWAPLLLLLFLAFLGGGLVGGALLAAGLKKRKDGIPFGPFLVLAAFIVSMWGERLISWYVAKL